MNKTFSMIKQSYFYSFVLALGYTFTIVFIPTGIAHSRERDSLLSSVVLSSVCLIACCLIW